MGHPTLGACHGEPVQWPPWEATSLPRRVLNQAPYSLGFGQQGSRRLQGFLCSGSFQTTRLQTTAPPASGVPAKKGETRCSPCRNLHRGLRERPGKQKALLVPQPRRSLLYTVASRGGPRNRVGRNPTCACGASHPDGPPRGTAAPDSSLLGDRAGGLSTELAGRTHVLVPSVSSNGTSTNGRGRAPLQTPPSRLPGQKACEGRGCPRGLPRFAVRTGGAPRPRGGPALPITCTQPSRGDRRAHAGIRVPCAAPGHSAALGTVSPPALPTAWAPARPNQLLCSQGVTDPLLQGGGLQLCPPGDSPPAQGATLPPESP